MAQQSYARGALSLKAAISVFAVGLLVAGGAVMYGRMDQGQIDVSAAISNANTARTANGESPTVPPASRTYQNMPNGGLVGKGEEGTPPPPPPVENASTTEENATSTEQAQGEAGAGDESPSDSTGLAEPAAEN